LLAQQEIRKTSSTASQPVEKKPQTPAARMILVMAAICTGYFMVILDTTVVNVALVNIHQQLGATSSELQWVVDGYSLVFASLLLTGGALGDRLGSKKIFMAGLALFAISSALCGLAPSLLILQIARVLQGIGAALQIPTSLALLSHTFPDAKERARVIGIWGAVAGIGASTGPVLGGFLVNTLSWRSIFLLNVPVGILGFVLTLFFISTALRLPRRGLDLAAQATGIIALGTLTLAFIEGNVWGWSSLPILAAFGVFVLMAVGFLIIEKRTTHPMLPLGLFAVPTFSAGNTVGLFLNFGFYGQLFCMSLFFQQIRGYSPFIAGLALLPAAAMTLPATWLAGRITGSIGPRIPMVTGLALGGIGLLGLSLANTTTSYALICITLLAIGTGTGFTMASMTAAVIGSAPRERSGIAAAMLNTSRQIGGVLGVALLGALVSQEKTFVSGLHFAMLIAGVAFLLGCVLTWFAIQRGQRA
jgi:MFS transporter, DHA2 family, methylenomycin A resistance protein